MVSPSRSAPLLLDAARVRVALAPEALLCAVERSLLAIERGGIALAPSVFLPGDGGGFHLKSAYSTGGAADRPRAAVKMNGNFPDNPRRFGLPTIQGVLALLDLERGSILALLDSTSITALRTAAVSALAARRLARPDAATLALVGCGVQAHAHLDLLARDFALREIRLFDRDPEALKHVAARAAERGLAVSVARSAPEAAHGADLIATTTSSTAPLLDDADIAPGAFVAAVGADNPTKCELAPTLLARSNVVVDSMASAVANGDLRSALAAGAMTESTVRGALPALLAGKISGRAHGGERWILDSTGLAATDLAAASLAYDSAVLDPSTPRFDFASGAGGRRDS